MIKHKFRSGLSPVKIIVVKVGSGLLTPEKNGSHATGVSALVDDIVFLRKAGVKVILVSSGAIAHGILTLKLGKKPATIPMKQACASIGQIRLMSLYETLFAHHGVFVGQVLLSWNDLRNKNSYHNLRNTLFTLLEHGAMPIINENDSVAIEEIKVGDNDTLGAQISLLTNADVYVMLTDINGLYDANPKKNPAARQIPLVINISGAIHRYAEGAGTEFGVGGMITKLKAAETVCKSGIPALIGDGFYAGLLGVLTKETAGTLFVPAEKKMSAKHRWMTFTSKPHGSVIVDTGAKTAIQKNGKSLLAAGIKEVTGVFTVGDLVDICDLQNTVFARGITNYSAADTKKILGHKTAEIDKILGNNYFNCIIHRNNLVLL